MKAIELMSNFNLQVIKFVNVKVYMTRQVYGRLSGVVLGATGVWFALIYPIKLNRINSPGDSHSMLAVLCFFLIKAVDISQNPTNSYLL